MSSSTGQTETNVVLASGLALVGLLGVAGALLPPDILPGRADPGGEAGQAVQPMPAPGLVEPAQPAATPSGPLTPVFKPVELQSVSDDMPQPAPVPPAEPAVEMPAQPAIAVPATPAVADQGVSPSMPSHCWLPPTLSGPIGP